MQAVERLTTSADIVATVEADDGLPPLPAAVEVAAFRIVLEAVTNVVRHAHAHRCCVSLALAKPGLAVTIVDDGVGLPDDRRAGNGLATMRERAEELGGSFIVSHAHPGVRVTARLPAKLAAAPAHTERTVPA